MRTQFGFTTLKSDFHNNIESSESRSEMTGADGVDSGNGGDLCVRAHAQWMNWRRTAETSEHLPPSLIFSAVIAHLHHIFISFAEFAKHCNTNPQ